jgi:hypothetical protein
MMNNIAEPKALSEIHEIRLKHGRERKNLTAKEKVDLINAKGIEAAKKYGLNFGTRHV